MHSSTIYWKLIIRVWYDKYHESSRDYGYYDPLLEIEWQGDTKRHEWYACHIRPWQNSNLAGIEKAIVYLRKIWRGWGDKHYEGTPSDFVKRFLLMKVPYVIFDTRLSRLSLLEETPPAHFKPFAADVEHIGDLQYHSGVYLAESAEDALPLIREGFAKRDVEKNTNNLKLFMDAGEPVRLVYFSNQPDLRTADEMIDTEFCTLPREGEEEQEVEYRLAGDE
jgi:hypothetical protein